MRIVRFEKRLESAPWTAVDFTASQPPALAVDMLTTRLPSHYDAGAILAAVLDVFATAAIIVDANGRLHAHNHAARTLLRDAEGVTVVHNRLQVTVLALHERLRSALRRACNSASHRGTQLVEALLIPRRKAVAYHAAVLGPVWHDRALVLISSPEEVTVATLSTAAILYRLTPAELRVAEHLMLGASLEEIAQRLGVRINTVRSQLISLMRKTDVHRQAELVHRLHTVPKLGTRVTQHPELRSVSKSQRLLRKPAH